MFNRLPFLGPKQARMPGTSGQQSPFQNLLDPQVALPMAAALMGGQGNQQNFANAFGAAGPGIANQTQQRQQMQQRNRTLEFLRQNSPEMAQAVDSGMPVSAAWQHYLKQREAQKPNAPSFSKSPVYGKDAQGNTVMGQLSDTGEFKQTELPEGFDLAPGVQKVDLGTHWGVMDRSGAVTQMIPKDIAGAKAQEVIGKAEGEKQATRESTLAQMDEMLAAIDGVIDSPGREAVTGMSGIFNAPFGYPRPGSDSADFLARLEQLKGKAFLQAFESLKGGGQITEREGIAAQNAIARLQTSQSDEEFKAALVDLKAIVENAKARVTGAGVQPAPVQPVVVDGYTIKQVD